MAARWMMVHRDDGPHAFDGGHEGNFQVIPEIGPRGPGQGRTILRNAEKLFEEMGLAGKAGLPVLGLGSPGRARALAWLLALDLAATMASKASTTRRKRAAASGSPGLWSG